MKWAVLSFVVLSSPGCMVASLHQKIPVGREEIRVGMPEAEVLRILGQPDTIYPGGQPRISQPYSPAYPSPIGVGPDGEKWVYEKRRPITVIFLEYHEVVWLTTWE